MKKHLFSFIKIVITITLFIWITSKMDFAAIGHFRKTMHFPLLLVAAFFVLAQFFAGVYRWYLILPLFKINQPFFSALRVYWMGMFFNTCLPTGVAGDVLRIQVMQQANIPVSKLVNMVFLDRLIGLLVLLLVVEASILIFGSMLDHISFINLFQILAISGFVGFIFLSFLHRLPVPWHRFRILTIIQQVSLDMSRLWQHPIKTSLMFISTAMGVISQILAIYFLAYGLHLHIALLNCWILVPPVVLAMSLPISIGGWGIREGAMITFFSLIGISATASFALSVLFGIMMFIINLPGGVFWILLRKENIFIESENAVIEGELLS